MLKKGLIPLGSDQDEHPEFSLPIYNILGQGLGDTVNAFFILNRIRDRYPSHPLIVFGDERWKDFFERFPGISWRFFPKARDPRYPEGVVGPYSWAYDQIANELSSSPGQKAYIGVRPLLLPDQFARGESTHESILRSLGLNDPSVPFRPFVPLSLSDLQDCESFLLNHGLRKGKYILVAPHTWPDKDWGKKNFESVIRFLTVSKGLRVVIAGLGELGGFDVPGVVHSFDCSLPVVSALVQNCGLFLGHDSGLSHVAGAFNIPAIVLYAKGKIPAFEIRVHSPYAYLVLEKNLEISEEITVETVVSLSEAILEKRVSDQRVCPFCLRWINHVLEADSRRLHLRCFCGSRFIRPLTSNSPDSVPEEASDQQIPCEVFSQELLKDSAQNLDRQTIAQTLLISNPWTVSKESLADSPPDCYPSFDGNLAWRMRSGFHLKKIERIHGADLWRLQFNRDASDPLLGIPWGGSILRVQLSDYCRYFSWQSWATPLRWEGIDKAVLMQSGAREALRVSSIIFRFNPSLKMFRHMIKYALMVFFKRDRA